MTHPACPKRLARLYAKLETVAAVARDRGVNIAYVYDAIFHGRAPSVKNTEARTRLYFPKTDRKPARPKHTLDYINWWRHLPVSERRTIIQKVYERKGKS